MADDLIFFITHLCATLCSSFFACILDDIRSFNLFFMMLPRQKTFITEPSSLMWCTKQGTRNHKILKNIHTHTHKEGRTMLFLASIQERTHGIVYILYNKESCVCP
jgi:hypothetical protein